MDDAGKPAGLWTRRRLLGASAGVGAAALAVPALRWLDGGGAAYASDVFLTAWDDAQGGHWIGAVDAQGKRRFATPVDVRCHGSVMHPTGKRAIVVARRPGTTAYDVDLNDGEIRSVLHSAPERHFYGHACWSADGKVLFVTENDIPRGVGVMTVRDGGDLHVLEEFPTYGVGPHEVRMLDDGRTLVIANGGIATDPDQGRLNVNIPDMDPSLVYVDSQSGKLLEQVRPADHYASIRHLALGAHGLVAVAIQYEGPEDTLCPLVALHRRGEQLKPAETPHDVLVGMQRYALSACVSPAGTLGVTCPRGGLVVFYDAETGAFRRSFDVADAGGLALVRAGDPFVITTGRGEILEVDTRTLEPVGKTVHEVATLFDNHLSLVPTPRSASV